MTEQQFIEDMREDLLRTERVFRLVGFASDDPIYGDLYGYVENQCEEYFGRRSPKLTRAIFKKVTFSE